MSIPLAPSCSAVHGQWLSAALLSLRNGQPLVLVTVLRALGSTPRDAGARMWVDAQAAHATIGGGHLELQAIAAARAMLEDRQSAAVQLHHYALGPSLGQCCGGAVWLAFERLEGHDLPWCEVLQEMMERGVSARRMRHYAPAQESDKPAEIGQVHIEALSASASQPDAQWLQEQQLLVDIMPASAPLVVVCGAGHVGGAIVRVLAELPVRVAWLDPREDQWPAQLPENVVCVEGDAQDVINFPDGAYWLVLTHSHALDLEIIEQLLRHKSFRYLGLIGSHTKRAKFRARLLRKFSSEQVDRMVCPIGVIDTSSKLPGVIAVSVAAQLLSLLEQSDEPTPQETLVVL